MGSRPKTRFGSDFPHDDKGWGIQNEAPFSGGYALKIRSTTCSERRELMLLHNCSCRPHSGPKLGQIAKKHLLAEVWKHNPELLTLTINGCLLTENIMKRYSQTGFFWYCKKTAGKRKEGESILYNKHQKCCDQVGSILNPKNYFCKIKKARNCHFEGSCPLR